VWLVLGLIDRIRVKGLCKGLGGLCARCLVGCLRIPGGGCGFVWGGTSGSTIGGRTWNERMAVPAPYAEALRREVEHAPVKPSKSEELRQAEQKLRDERIEPELVAATTQQGRYAQIHNTKPTPGETLPEGLVRSKAGFLLKVEPVKAKVDIEKVKKEMELLARVAVIAYFVGGHQHPKVL
jgi:hypothetical protein